MSRKERNEKLFLDSNVIYERKGDYDPYMKLIIKEDQLGDISIGIMDLSNRKEPIRLVKFATIPGGGKSMKTLSALQSLALAIEKDNKNNPNYR